MTGLWGLVLSFSACVRAMCIRHWRSGMFNNDLSYLQGGKYSRQGNGRRNTSCMCLPVHVFFPSVRNYRPSLSRFRTMIAFEQAHPPPSPQKKPSIIIGTIHLGLGNMWMVPPEVTSDQLQHGSSSGTPRTIPEQRSTWPSLSFRKISVQTIGSPRRLGGHTCNDVDEMRTESDRFNC